jgi:hypothetical protein
MVSVAINPGSGPVEKSTEDHALENIKHLINDIKIEGIKFIRLPDDDYGDGRFAFLLWRYNHCHEVQMPGIPLSQVRFMKEEGQNIWDFPRLYVDDSSWIWCIALNLLFKGEEEE